MSTLRLALVQLDVVDGEPAQNLEHATALISEHVGADLYLLPELWTSGYAHRAWAEVADRHTPNTLSALRTLATERQATIGGTLISRNEQGRLVNRFWLVNPAGASTSYDKAHLFPPMDEPTHLVPGTRRVRTALVDWTAALSICFDLRFPGMYRLDALAGADLFLVPSAWPAERSEAMRLLARARAMENQVFLALSNRTGKGADGTLFGGGSLVVAPDGAVLAEAGAEPGITTAKVERERIEAVRGVTPHLALHRSGVDY
jgi:omega-amidase